MSWAGLEPAINGLRGRCSTIELPAHLENLDFKKFEGRFSDVPYERSELRDLWAIIEDLVKFRRNLYGAHTYNKQIIFLKNK